MRLKKYVTKLAKGELLLREIHTNQSRMKLISVNIGLPRKVNFRGEVVTTGIYKEPVKGRVKLRKLNLEGDGQADLSVHGGEDKAVYAYPMEHYEYWRRMLPNADLAWGAFGENFTTEGLVEDTVNIGDEYKIGTAKLIVVQPRMPCYKLGVRFGRADIIKHFLVSGRSGFYFRVLQEGEVRAGDAIELISRDKNDITVKDVVRLFTHERDIEKLERASRVEALPEEWRDYFRKKLSESYEQTKDIKN